MSTIKRKKVSDLLGKKFNHLTVVSYLGKGRYDKHYWGCECDCGGYVELNTSRLTGNTPTRSCGCLRKEALLENRADPRKHGLSGRKIYYIYHSMKSRCYNPNSQRWKYYGAKGVTVCEEWSNVESFCKWAEENGYKEGLSIDRINPDLGYSPDNCEWVTVSENSRRVGVGKRQRKIQQVKVSEERG